MSRWLTLLVIGISFFSCMSAVAGEEASLAPLKAWVGKYPEEKIDGKTAFDVNGFKEKIEALLGKSRFKIFRRDLKISSQVKQKGNLLYFNFCKPHICMGTVADFYVNLKDNTVQGCWMINEEIDGFWLITGKKPSNVGPAGCLATDEFAFYEKNQTKK